MTCKGCLHKKDDETCFSILPGKEEDCPCRKCIIKMICETTCEQFSSYTNGKTIGIATYMNGKTILFPGEPKNKSWNL